MRVSLCSAPIIRRRMERTMGKHSFVFLKSPGTYKWFLLCCFILPRVPCAISTMFRLDRTKILNPEAKGHPFFDGLTNNAS